MLRPEATARKTPTWPTPTPEQVEVVLLGTYHMDGSSLDEANLDTDDVLEQSRQRELESLVGHLEAAEPDRVAVEHPAEHSAGLEELYAGYRDGRFAYDEDHEFEPSRSAQAGDAVSCRSEVVQVGFRLADRLGHEQVFPVDVPEMLGEDEAFEKLETQGVDTSPRVDIPRPEVGEFEAAMNGKLATSTVTAYYRYLNEEAALHANDLMFDRFLRQGAGDNYAGPDALGRWYRRNLRMVHNIWRTIDDGSGRVLFLVGSGHVHVLRHLLTEFPQFCPVSPLRYLPQES